MRKPIVGVIGPGEKARKADIEAAEELGRRIADLGWVTLSGGRNSGVMEAANRGAKARGGTTVGVLPTSKREMISPYVDIPIITDMGNARNNINVLTSDVIIACGVGPGTVSEIALAIKARKKVILVLASASARKFFEELAHGLISFADSAEHAISLARKVIDNTLP
ncbi:MAG TPA: TIGR00725 family protein [Syntrophorhabdaceae bacterium]|nr:TIGR00725 family protein [Syntrophorhabdaceae bacterium]